MMLTVEQVSSPCDQRSSISPPEMTDLPFNPTNIASHPPSDHIQTYAIDEEQMVQLSPELPSFEISQLKYDASAAIAIEAYNVQNKCGFCETESNSGMNRFGFTCNNCLDVYSDMSWFHEAEADLKHVRIGSVPASTMKLVQT